MDAHSRSLAFPATLFGGFYWTATIYSKTTRAVTNTYNFLEDRVTGCACLIYSVTEELLTGVSKPSSELRNFPQFSKLPSEIRCQIWRETFDESRVIELRDGPGHRGQMAAQKIFTPWISPAVLPTVLQVCQESRGEALRHYELSFSRSGFPPQIYVNFQNDIIYFGYKTRSDGALDMDGHTRGFEKIQHMAIGFNGMSRLVDWKLNELISLKDIIMLRSMTPARCVKLGRSPRLIEFEQDDGEEGEFKMDVTRAVAMYAKRLRERQSEDFPDWEVPLLKVGMLVRSGSDGKYY